MPSVSVRAGLLERVRRRGAPHLGRGHRDAGAHDPDGLDLEYHSVAYPCSFARMNYDVVDDVRAPAVGEKDGGLRVLLRRGVIQTRMEYPIIVVLARQALVALLLADGKQALHFFCPHA